MFKSRKFFATAKKPASILISNHHFDIVIEDGKVTVYQDHCGVNAIFHNASIKNVGVAKITLSTCKKHCAISLANNKGFIELKSEPNNLMISLFNGKEEQTIHLSIKQ